MHQKHFLSPQFLGLAGDVRFLVSSEVVIRIRQSQIPLSVDGVVVDPICNRGHSDAAFEDAVTLRVSGQCRQGHKA